MEQITKELYVSPMLDRNLDKYGQSDNQCICCGKPMKPDDKQYVHMNTNWLAVHSSITDVKCLEMTGAESQGMFPIGNECAKKMKGFIFNSL